MSLPENQSESEPSPGRSRGANVATANGGTPVAEVDLAETPRSGSVSGAPPLTGIESDKTRRSGFEIGYHRLLAFSDVVAILLAMLVAVALLTVTDREINIFRLSVTVGVMLPVWFVIAYVAGLYSFADLKINHGLVDEIGKVVIAATAWSWLLLVARTVLAVGPTAMAGPILLWMTAIPLMLLSRATVREVARRRFWNRQPVAVVGEWLEVRSLHLRIQRHPEWGLDVSAEFDFSNDSMIDVSDLADEVQRSGVERVVIVGGGEGLSARTSLVHELIEHGLMVDIISGGPETVYSNAALQTLEGMPILSVRSTRRRTLDLGMKRAFDLLVSGVGLIMVAPILAWAAIRIKLDSPGPVFFRQVRCGHFGEEFEMLKLRTMVDGADSMRAKLREETAFEGNNDVLFKLKDDPRVTDFGQILRKWSIDELPQLWNVFVGEMSMVGPRPLPFDEALQATGLFRARIRAKPGIAGPWQAYGRSTIPFSEMIKLDYSYVVGWSIAEDIRLLLLTSVAVARGRGAY